MNPTGQLLKTAFARNEAACNRVNQLLHLLSSKGRFRIVCLLCLGEFCVQDIAEVVDQGRLSNISQHLKMLTLSGVVERRREDRRVLYRIRDERVRSIMIFLREQFLQPGAGRNLPEFAQPPTGRTCFPRGRRFAFPQIPKPSIKL